MKNGCLRLFQLKYHAYQATKNTSYFLQLWQATLLQLEHRPIAADDESQHPIFLCVMSVIVVHQSMISMDNHLS